MQPEVQVGVLQHNTCDQASTNVSYVLMPANTALSDLGLGM
jgi:hypothetical protein